MKATKGPRGWSVEETIEHGEDRWYVTTSKRFSGKVSCSAVLLDKPTPGMEDMISYSATSPMHHLFHNTASATEKNVNGVHQVGLRKLKEILETKP